MDIASEWMAAGCVAQANLLLPVIREAGDLAAFASPLVAFEIPWLLAGVRPTPWPAAVQSVDKIELDLWTLLFGPHNWSDAVVDQVKNADLEELHGRRRLIRAAIICYDEARSDRVATPGRLSEAATLLDGLLDAGSPDIVGSSLFRALTCRVILAARLGDIEDAKRYLILWGEAYKAYPSNWIVWYPLMDRSVATILLGGILAPVWQITPQQCERDAEVIVRAVRERLSTGRQLAYANLSWSQLLVLLRDLAQKDHSTQWIGDDQSLERKPATPSAIEAAEVRLGRCLPEDYRQFLRVSNGFGTYSATGVEVLPVENIRWLRDAKPELIRSYEQFDASASLVERLQESLLIGRDAHDEQQLLLVPGEKDTTELECWFVAHWLPEENRHPTFRYFIESEIGRLSEAA
jgi:hypothetical protein